VEVYAQTGLSGHQLLHCRDLVGGITDLKGLQRAVSEFHLYNSSFEQSGDGHGYL
jgi:hypothetical protein